MSNNKQQTAVEWQYIELSKFLTGFSEFTEKSDILIKAREMEKEQKADTWNNAINAVEKDKWDSFEQFYEQTYEGDK
jgi:hypothetical protein